MPSESGQVAHDWRAEALGLAWMILTIERHHQQAVAHLGGDSELLRSAIYSAAGYVSGPLAKIEEATRVNA